MVAPGASFTKIEGEAPARGEPGPSNDGTGFGFKFLVEHAATAVGVPLLAQRLMHEAETAGVVDSG